VSSKALRVCPHQTARRVALIVALVVTLVGAPTSGVRAQGAKTVAEQVEQMSAQGVALYQAGDFSGALIQFRAALALQPVGNLLFNIARTLERLGRNEEALAYYRQFVAAPDAEPGPAAKARARVLALEGAAKAAALEAAQATPRAARPTATPTDLGLSEQDSAPNLEVAGWATAACGIAILAVGVTLGVLSDNAEQEFANARTIGDKDKHRERAENMALGADLSFGLGAAAAVTGLALLIVEWAGGSDDHSEASLPKPVVGLGGVGFTF
jgi:tetratricopeptide (TPR) repeat protein